MSKSQKIIEAEANLQVAKMFESINRIRDAMKGFAGIYDGDINDTEKTLTNFVSLVRSLHEFSKTTCNGQDLKMVTDIIDGIKLRSKYETEMKDLNNKLSISENAFKKVTDANTHLLKVISNICVTKSEKKQATELVKEAKQYRQKDVIERLFVESAKPLSCDDEDVF